MVIHGDLIEDADPRVLSSTQAMTLLAGMSKQILPNGMNIEWTDLSPAGHAGQYGRDRLPGRGIAGVLVLLYMKADATGGDPYRPDDHALRAVWRPHWRRQ